MYFVSPKDKQVTNNNLPLLHIHPEPYHHLITVTLRFQMGAQQRSKQKLQVTLKFSLFTSVLTEAWFNPHNHLKHQQMMAGK